MFSDTHFHFEHLTKNLLATGEDILSEMARRNCFFGLDIGTRSDDLLSRESCVDRAISQIKDGVLADKVRSFMYFSAGIWPDAEAIRNRLENMRLLCEQIDAAASSSDNDILHRKIIAIGECGLDHHWNPSGVDGRASEDFDEKMLEGEAELFEMQIDLAKKMALPVIVHSRDAFDGTYRCIKNSGYSRGVIHCFSYGKDEARAFLDLGWYVSFAGGVTYTKKSKMDAMVDLLRFIPKDRILCETDSPYLAPVPFRGSQNTPLLVEHIYTFIANARGVSPEDLSNDVDKNIQSLFNCN
ncbi:MAG: TatD family hydrolase [Treponema sp.]|nr:TatD family hydrolase [Treponema sp.]